MSVSSRCRLVRFAADLNDGAVLYGFPFRAGPQQLVTIFGLGNIDFRELCFVSHGEDPETFGNEASGKLSKFLDLAVGIDDHADILVKIVNCAYSNF